ncbi:hypothetical protein AC578_1387 [Pseudocercospora eumusae]|uniref:Uncharacterized protein n=1 Tax=Pseudocercospora eumusae TaxID=321146 RepID=A0A139HUH6_9PEZI|nr:hypothetical protein AC578_1387 [Pseudocercospora eumusae]
MESAISLGVLTGVSWGASKYHEKRIAANNKKKRREQRHHQAEIQRHKLRADFEREKREVAERERSKVSKQLEAARLDYRDSFAHQLACVDSGGYITCLQPAASTTSNGSSNALDEAGGASGLSPTTYIIALLLILLLAATGFFFFIADQPCRHCRKELEAKDENVEQLNSDFTTMAVSLEDIKQQLSDSEHHKEASEASAGQLEINLAEVKVSLDHANQELGKVITELSKAKQKHRDNEMLARRVLAKYGGQVREAREAHLILKYGLMWRLRVRDKTTASVAASATNVLDKNESDGSDDDDEEGAENPPTPDVNGPEEQDGEGKKSSEQADEQENTGKEQKTGREQKVGDQEMSKKETPREVDSNASQPSKSHGGKGAKDARKKRGMRPALRNRLIAEGALEPWRDPKWIDPDTGLPSNGKPPQHLREQWAAEKAKKKGG